MNVTKDQVFLVLGVLSLRTPATPFSSPSYAMQDPRRCIITFFALVSFVGGAFDPMLSSAQQAPPKPWSLRLFWENDSRPVVPNGTDEHYTQGARIEFAKASCGRPWWGGFVGERLKNYFGWDENSPPSCGFADRTPWVANTGYVIGQNMYTPRDLLRSDVIVGDRPYAGWVYFGVTFAAASTAQTHALEVDLGTTGPNAYAGDVQAWFHKYISHGRPPHGWQHQVAGQFAVQSEYEWRHRTFLINASCNGFCVDALPDWGVALGDVQTFGHAGGIVRFGLNTSGDWPERIPITRSLGELDAQKAASELSVKGTHLDANGSASHRNHFFEAYAFVGGDARAVAYNFSLDGNLFGGVDVARTYGVHREPLVGDIEGGLAFRISAIMLAYRLVVRSHEFSPGDTRHIYASPTLTISSRWCAP